jgi:hypothetical protein
MNTINYHYKPKSTLLFECNFCKKTYKNKLNYDKHSLICELLQDKDNKFSTLDELLDNSNCLLERNSQQNINNCILIELMKSLLKKYNNLSNEMIEIKKWIHKEKKQINIIDWLNNTENKFNPTISFEDYINNLPFSEDYIKKIIHNNIHDVYLNYIDEMFSNEVEDISVFITDNADIETKINIPICCFSQKQNVFYIYTDIDIVSNDKESNLNTNTTNNKTIKNKLSTFIWREATRDDLIKLFGKIKNKFVAEFCSWYDYQQSCYGDNNSSFIMGDLSSNKLQYQYNSYQYNLKSREKLDEVFNKSVLKLMTDISGTNLFQKLKNKLYNKIKIDIKQFVEYNFTF